MLVESLSSLTSHEEIEDIPAATELLRDWYRADENGVPPVMVLMVCVWSYDSCALIFVNECGLMIAVL